MVAPTNYPQPSEPESNQAPKLAKEKPLPWWRFAAPLFLQTALILAVPSQQVYTHITGTTVILATRPVDPYDIMRGYYQTLSYQISSRGTLESLPGWEEVAISANYNSNSQSFYVIMAAPDQPNTSKPPTPWQPVAISRDRPTDLDSNQVAIEGEFLSQWRIRYGLETYYMPEDRRQKINNQIREAQREEETFVVEVKVDRSGNSVPVSLWVREINYKF